MIHGLANLHDTVPPRSAKVPCWKAGGPNACLTNMMDDSAGKTAETAGEQKPIEVANQALWPSLRMDTCRRRMNRIDKRKLLCYK